MGTHRSGTSGDLDTRECETFVELFRRRSADNFDKIAVSYLLDGEEMRHDLTYGQLDGSARAMAIRLLSEFSPGDRALILQPPGLGFVVSFLGCLYAGIVAVPAYPPRNARQMPRVEAILRDSGAALVLTSEEAHPKITSWLGARTGHIRIISSRSANPAHAESWIMPSLKPDMLAFLQYTSGSTGEPRGVMVTHDNIMANEEMICNKMGLQAGSTVVSWLPIYHDMGLIGNLLQPLFLGGRAVLMSPASFLQRPARWLSAISRFRAAVSGGPDFSLDLCVRTVTSEQKAGLNLGCLEVMYCGSEPINPRTLKNFASAFRECGLRPESLYPTYGLAEATLICTGGRPGSGPRYLEVDSGVLEIGRCAPAVPSSRQSRRLVSCGDSAVAQGLRIVDPVTRVALGEELVGEIWLTGPHITAGYWRNKAETTRLYRASLTTGEGPFLRTGDLGFLHSGEIYVIGRMKDLILIRGRNHYPQDIERTIELNHPVLQPGACAAFSVTEEGIEYLVVAMEARRETLKHFDGETLAASIRRIVVEAHGLAVHALAVLKPLALPKTSSGKLRRGATKSNFLSGTLDTVFCWRETNPQIVPRIDPAAKAATGHKHQSPVVTAVQVEGWLCSWLAKRLAIPATDIDPLKPFAEFGVDSASAVELTGELSEWLGTSLPVSMAWDFPNIRTFAASTVATRVKQPVTSESVFLETLSQAELTALLQVELETLRRSVNE